MNNGNNKKRLKQKTVIWFSSWAKRRQRRTWLSSDYFEYECVCVFVSVCNTHIKNHFLKIIWRCKQAKGIICLKFLAFKRHRSGIYQTQIHLLLCMHGIYSNKPKRYSFHTSATTTVAANFNIFGNAPSVYKRRRRHRMEKCVSI